MIRKELSIELTNPDRNLMALVAVDDRETLLGVIAWELSVDESTAAVILVGTDSDHRKAGIAESLFNECFAYCVEHAVTSATFEIHKANEPMRSLVLRNFMQSWNRTVWIQNLSKEPFASRLRLDPLVRHTLAITTAHRFGHPLRVADLAG